MAYAAPRGTRDIMPEETPLWRWLEEKFRRIAELYQYREIRTPMFEQTHVFSRTSGESSDIVTKQMYTFNDRGDESLTLRPEGTASVVRAFVEHGIGATQPLAKLCYVTPVFRYERPQAGRYRQHHQVGIEAIGSQDPALDAEVIGLGNRYLADLGITGASLFINTVGCPVCRPRYREILLDFLRPLLPQLSEDSQRRFDANPMRILDSKEERDRELTAEAPVMIDYMCDECRDHFEMTKTYLSDVGASFEIDPRLVRGLDYYTKTAFEFKHPELGAQDTILAGGRYDGLVEQFGGSPAPGVGFGSGIERALLALKADGALPELAATAPQVYLAAMGDAARRKVVSILDALRREGIPAEMSYGARSLKSQMKQADKSGAKLAVILGDDELARGVATARRMDSSEQSSLALEDLPRQLKDLLSQGA